METNDYKKFKFHEANRPLSESTINKLINSIRDFGFIEGRPVLVDENFVVIDGQHRLEALKRLNMPIVYDILKGDAISKIMVLNSSQVQWKLIDYINSYATQGVDCYRKLLKFEEKYKLGTSSSIDILFIGNKHTSSDIRKGKVFQCNDDANEVAEFVLKCSSVPYYKKQSFVRSIAYFFKKSNVSQREKVVLNIMSIPECGTMGQYLTCFENLLNHKKRGDNRIKL